MPHRRSFLEAAFTGAAALTLPAWNNLSWADENDAFRPDTLFLTWQHDPTTTMTVQWIGVHGETSDNAIYYQADVLPDAGVKDAPKDLPAWSKQPTVARPYAETDLKVYRAELTGLKPGTNYKFKIGKLSPVFRFSTMPARATNAIHFVSGGDCGVNQHAINNNIQAARQDPMFTLIGGDLGYDNGKSVEISLAFIRNYSKHMLGRNGRLIPLVACLGNHEVDGGYDEPRSKAPFFYALFDGLFTDTGFASLDFGDYLSLILLDTGHTTPIAGEQTAWLEKTLRERADCPHVIVANHVPAYPSYRNFLNVKGQDGTGELNRQHWTPLFDKYRTPIVLEHHDHTFKRTKPLVDGREDKNGVLYLGDGSWGKLRAPQSPEKLSYLAASSRDYHSSLHRLEGDERFHLAMDEFGRVVDVVRSEQRSHGAFVGGRGNTTELAPDPTAGSR